jgi:hypothetical protein
VEVEAALQLLRRIVVEEQWRRMSCHMSSCTSHVVVSVYNFFQYSTLCSSVSSY